jgi:aminoglycoside/choline kinase family phosphotransferase
VEQPQVVVHRDFHSRNLMVVRNQELAVIDFQDAVIGPITYDPISLLKDCYVSWPRQRQIGWLLDYKRLLVREQLMSAMSDDTFIAWFDLMGLQRHVKVLGIFARLCLRDGKPAYLEDLPLVLAYVIQALAIYAPSVPAIARFAEVFDQQVLPACKTQSWYSSVALT